MTRIEHSPGCHRYEMAGSYEWACVVGCPTSQRELADLNAIRSERPKRKPLVVTPEQLKAGYEVATHGHRCPEKHQYTVIMHFKNGNVLVKDPMDHE